MATERFVIVIQAQGLNTAQRGMDRMSRSARRATSQVNALRKSLAFLRSALVVVASIRVFSGLIRTLADFGQEMSTVRAITSATESQFGLLREEAKRLGATTRFSATEAAQGMTFLARAGFSVQEVLDSTEQVLNLAQASALGLGRAADIASNVMQGFGLTTRSINRVVDVLAAASNDANTNVQQLGDALKLVAPVARSFGLELEETTAAVGVLSDAGLQATVAGTGLRRVISELEKGGPKLERVVKAFNKELKDVRPTSVGLTQALKTLKESGIDPASFAMDVFGQRGGPVFLQLLADLDKLEEKRKTLDRAAGSAKRMADIMDQNLNGALKAVASRFENLLITFGDLGPTNALTQALRGLADLLARIANNADEVTEVLKLLAVVLATRLAVALLLVSKRLNVLLIALGLIITFKEDIEELAGSFDSVDQSSGTTAANVKKDWANLGDTLTGMSQGIASDWTDAWDIIRLTGGRTALWIENQFNEFWVGIKAIGGRVLNFFIDQFKGLLGAVKLLVQALPGGVGDKLIDPNALDKFKVDVDVSKSEATKANERRIAEADRLIKVLRGRLEEGRRIAGEIRKAEDTALSTGDLKLRGRLREFETGKEKPSRLTGRRVNVRGGDTGGKSLQDELDRIIGKSNAARKAALELAKAEDVLNRAVKAGLISRENANKVLEDYQRKLADALDPLGAMNREIKKEIDLLKMSARERAIHEAFLEAEKKLRKEGVFLTQEQAKALRELIALRERERRISQAKDRIESSLPVTAAQNAREQFEALKRLAEQGKVSGNRLRIEALKIREAYLNTRKDMAAGFELAFNKMEQEARDFAGFTEELVNKLVDGLTDAIVKFVETGKFEFADLARSIGKFLLQAGLKQLIGGVGGSLFGGIAGGPSGGGPGGAGGLLGGLLGGLGSLLGFERGGSFMVGGSNSTALAGTGNDNRLVAFRAQRGEEVSVTPRGGSRGGTTVNINVSTPDADSFQRSQGQILARTKAAMDRADRRNN